MEKYQTWEEFVIRYHLNCTGVEDKNFTDEIIRISRKYRNPVFPLVYEKVVADNLCIRRLMLGCTLDKIAAYKKPGLFYSHSPDTIMPRSLFHGILQISNRAQSCFLQFFIQTI